MDSVPTSCEAPQLVTHMLEDLRDLLAALIQATAEDLNGQPPDSQIALAMHKQHEGLLEARRQVIALHRQFTSEWCSSMQSATTALYEMILVPMREKLRASGIELDEPPKSGQTSLH